MAQGLVDAVPEMAKELWQALRRPAAQGGVPTEALTTAVAEVAALEPQEASRLAAEALDEEAADLAPAQRTAALAYLGAVPATLRQSLRRPEDPSGRTVPPYQRFERPADLALLLPRRVSRLTPGTIVHGLELLRLVGSGGYGEVWQATPKGVPDAEPVALKFCTDERARRQLLEHEAKLAARVMKVGRHPNIVRLLRLHLDDEVPSLEFEFVAGGDLHSLVKGWHERGEALDPLDALELMLRVLEPFRFMHAATPAIVHRDAKLSNILIDNQGNVRVTDFGIGGLAFTTGDVALSRRGAALSMQPQYTEVARGAYTPHYASREQMQGEDPHPADDVYSLGVILYQLLTGRLAEGAPSGDWQDELADAGVPTGAVDVLKKALARSRDRRYPNAGAMLDALDAVCCARGRNVPDATLSAVRTRRPETTEYERAPVPEPRGARPKFDAATDLAMSETSSCSKHVNGIGQTLISVELGTFQMGSPGNESDRRADERRHTVALTRPFALAETGVTQKQWFEVMGTRPWRGHDYVIEGNDVAATYISWTDAVEFCGKLTERERGAGRLFAGLAYRLPTEAEREYATRAGSTGAYCFGDDVMSLSEYAVFEDERDGEFAHAVKSRKPNVWGFYDLHGNVWEWCADAANDVNNRVVTDTYREGVEDPLCQGGPRRVSRGGSWLASSADGRSARRIAREPGVLGSDLGFRPVLAATSKVE